MNNKIKLTINILLIVSFLSILIKTSIDDYLKKKKYTESNFQGIIEYKRISKNHALREFMINNEWFYFTSSLDLEYDIIQIGDSVIKKGGTDTIDIYRKEGISMYKKIFPR